MGIFDLLGDLSSKRSQELGLGGLQSLLGTRGAAQAGAIGDEMINITNKDSLPGYFNEQTREYVPWYVDLFDGGGLNAAGSQAEQEAAMSGGAPMAQPGLLANNQLSDMELANRNRASQMTPSLGSQLSDIERANRNRVGVDPRNLGGSEGYGPMPARDPRNLGGAAGYGPMGQTMSAIQQVPQSIPASGGDMAINTPAAQNRDQMIADRQAYNQEQAIKSHPLYPEYVDFLNQSGLASVPGLFERYLKVTGAN